MNKYRVREVNEYIIEADSKVDALHVFYMAPLPDAVATELRIRAEEV